MLFCLLAVWIVNEMDNGLAGFWSTDASAVRAVGHGDGDREGCSGKETLSWLELS